MYHIFGDFIISQKIVFTMEIILIKYNFILTNDNKLNALPILLLRAERT